MDLTNGSLRQLMALDSPKVLLKRMIKTERPPSNLIPQSVPPTVKKENATLSSSSSCCLLCREGDPHLYILSFSSSDPHENDGRKRLLRTLVLDATRMDYQGDIILTFCSVCRSALAKFFMFREELEELQTRVRTVVRLRQQQLVPSFGLGQLLDSPKVILGPRRSVIMVKEEMRDNNVSPPKDEVANGSLAVKKEVEFEEQELWPPSGNQSLSLPSLFCSLCTNCLGNGDAFLLNDDTDPRRGAHVRSLLEGIPNAEAPLIFCTVCRSVCMRLSHLFKEVDDIQARIRAVVKLRKEETATEGEEDDDGSVVSNASAPTTRRRRQRTVGLQLEQSRNPTVERGGKSFCPICNQGFFSLDIFKAHRHPDPEGDPTQIVYTCDTCGKQLGTPDTLTQHKRRVHLKQQAGSCAACGKVFLTKASLEDHRSFCSVSKEQRRRCEKCGKDFASRAERLEHERVVHKGLFSTRSYFCSKAFPNTSGLHCPLTNPHPRAPLRLRQVWKGLPKHHEPQTAPDPLLLTGQGEERGVEPEKSRIPETETRED